MKPELITTGELQHGDIILFKPTSTTGRLIAWIDGSPYSHVGIYWGMKNSHHLFIESHEKKGGVGMTRLEDWRNFIVIRPYLKHRPKRELLAKLGARYDVSMIGWILWSKIFRKMQYNNDDEALICSELVDWYYYYKIGNGFVATPKTFYKLIR
jgi:hypothetical protein